MPEIVKDPLEQIYGKVPFELPLTSEERVVRYELQRDPMQYDKNVELYSDPYIQSLYTYGMGAPAPLQRQVVRVPVAQPVKGSTFYAVIGISALAVVGSIGLWMYMKKK